MTPDRLPPAALTAGCACPPSTRPDPRGNLRVTLVRDETEQPAKAIELWQVFKLSRQQRDALAKELRELFERYAKTEGGGETFLAHAAFAPRP